MRHTCGSGDLAKACALGMSLADRFTPGSVGLGATYGRPLNARQGSGHSGKYRHHSLTRRGKLSKQSVRSLSPSANSPKNPARAQLPCGPWDSAERHSLHRSWPASYSRRLALLPSLTPLRDRLAVSGPRLSRGATATWPRAPNAHRSANLSTAQATATLKRARFALLMKPGEPRVAMTGLNTNPGQRFSLERKLDPSSRLRILLERNLAQLLGSDRGLGDQPECTEGWTMREPRGDQDAPRLSLR